MVERLHGDEFLSINLPEIDPLDMFMFAGQRDE